VQSNATQVRGKIGRQAQEELKRKKEKKKKQEAHQKASTSTYHCIDLYASTKNKTNPQNIKST
jgi:hypothetical protein